MSECMCSELSIFEWFILKIIWSYSTGIGRTGTYIALDYLYKTGKKSGSVNVAEYVKTMRGDRMNMVSSVVSK